MATYLKGSNKYIPQIQPYQPDFNFYKTVLDTKTAQYEAGYDRVNSIYGTLLNSPLTRQDTSTMRNDFFSKANNEIQRLAGVDLSIEDNQRAAFQVFKPLTTNKLFAKDVNFTKDVYNEYDRAEFFRNCLNPKDCGGKYWDGGVQYLQYKAQDFANATEQEAMNMSSPKYVPFVNVVDDAVDFAIKSKLEMQTVSSDGRYIYTTTNGTPMEAPLYNYFLAKYGNEQQVADMYNVSAYLQRKNYGQEKAAEFGSEEAAEADYIRQVIDAENKANRESKIASQETKETINAKKTVVEDYIKQNGVDPDEDQDLIEYYRRLNDDEAVADETDNYYTQSLDITSPTAIEGLSQSALAARADAILARGLLSKDLADAATSYAQLTQKQDVKADPIYLENLNFSHQVSLKSMEIENQWRKAAYDYANDLEKKLIDSRLKTDLKPTAYQKSLALLNGATATILDQFSKVFGSEDDEDIDEEDTKKKSKSPQQLQYEMELQENAVKQKELKENELEFYIHQLRGHGSEAVWNSMGEAKLLTLGITKKEDISFLDSGDVQKQAAEQAGISTGEEQGAQQTQQAPSGDGAQVQTPSADSTAVTTNIPTNLPDSTATAQTEQQVSTELPTDTSSVATTDSIPFSEKPASEKYANTQAQAQTTQQDNPFAGLQTQQDIDELNEYAQAPAWQKLFNPRAQEFNRALEASQDSTSVEAILKGAEQYAQYAVGADSLSTNLQNANRTSARALLAGTQDMENSLLGVLMPWQLIGSNKETAVGAIDPTSTEEFKNIQLPSNESFISSLWKSGLGLSAEKISNKNAITAGIASESADITDFKSGTVDMLLKKYQDKVQYGSPSEKKSALSTIKKMFPGAARMGLIGDDGQVKNSDIFPYMKLAISSSENFDKIVSEYEKDPMFRNDPDKLNGTIAEQIQLANIQSQTEKAMQIIDQYNIAKVGAKMETNPGMLAHGNGTELRDFMDKYLFKQMGNINAANSPANGAPLKAVRTEEDFKNDIYNNPKVWAAADVIADAMIDVTITPEDYGNFVTSHPSFWFDDSDQPGLLAANLALENDLYAGQNSFNPNIIKKFNTSANKALGIDNEGNNFFKMAANAYSGKPKPFNESNKDIVGTVDVLNKNGINGKELLKNAIMETWTSEGRTTEWNVYSDYSKKNNGQVPYLEFPEIPVVGYDTFRREYGIAAADKNTDLQTYSPRNLIADSYKGQGGLTAQPYGINFNEGVELAVATGNQDFIGLIDNLKQSISTVDRKAPYNAKSYLVKMPYTDVLNKLDISDDKPEDWSWDNTWFAESIEDNHKKNSEALLNLLSGFQNELKNQTNVGNFKKLDLLDGTIKTYPIAAGVSNMTAYEIVINGEKAKAAGYQQDNKDLVFTALIPRTQAVNSLYKRTTNRDWVDLALWATGKAVINVPGSGMLSITQDAEDNYVINGQMYTADEVNGLISPQQIDSQRASKGTIPGFLFANQLMQQLIDNYKYQAQLSVDRKAQKTNLEKNPYKLLERPNT